MVSWTAEDQYPAIIRNVTTVSMDLYSLEKKKKKKDSKSGSVFLTCNIMAHGNIFFDSHFKKTSKHLMVVPKLAFTF